MELPSNTNMCRCCASEGTFKDMKTKYHWMGDEEVYADILRECLDVCLMETDTGEDGGICEVCITQLRNAANFKKQVLHTEEQFKLRLENKMFKSDIKTELAEDSNESDNDASEDYIPDFEVPVKSESVDESKPKKRAARTITLKAKKAKKSTGEPSARRETRNTMKLKRKSLSLESDAESHDESFDKLGTPKEDPVSEASSPRERLHVETSSSRKRKLKVIKFDLCTRKISFKKQKKYGEIKKHLHNIRTILLNSNATPIKCKQGIWYSCCFCKDSFSDPIELKIHTMETHDDSTKLDFMNDTILTKFIVKLDISGLQCNCSKSFENLNDLIDHLVKDHSETYHTDINSQIVPFRFESGLLKCIICEAAFNSFKLFIEHMNLHFPNYVCGQCGRGFVTKERLQIHFSRHRNEGVFSCSFCTKVFNSKIRQKEHMRQVHITQNKRNKCGICGEKFTDYTHKYKHEEEVHGIKKTLLHCQACDKSYNNQRALTAHKKTFHLMEYPKKKTVLAS